MSEHKTNNTRYWKREEPDSSVVYFLTESNAAHSRAEADQHAFEIAELEYKEHVPEEARTRPYDATNGSAAGTGSKSQAEVIEAYKAACAGQMIGMHQQVVNLLLSADVTNAERIFVLEAVKHEIMASMMMAASQPLSN